MFYVVTNGPKDHHCFLQGDALRVAKGIAEARPGVDVPVSYGYGYVVAVVQNNGRETLCHWLDNRGEKTQGQVL
jgi:hypothetical protein